MNSCRNCGHYITGGGCYKNDTQVKVDRNHSCESWLPKDAPNTINASEDAYDNRLMGV